MKYIIVDFEWNQPLETDRLITEPIRFDSEIIEIGAIRLNESFEYEDELKMFVKPVFYPVMNVKVASLTKIRTQNLKTAPLFPEAYRQFAEWCGEDACLCTWGPGDVPVLMDNMLMHGMETPDRILWCDIQEIFGSETMRDHRQWSLENAISTLGLTKERAHDALNDVRNTCRICNRVDIYPFVDEYLYVYINYGRDKLSGILSGRTYCSIEEARSDEEMTSIVCPYCGEQVVLGEWICESRKSSLSYGYCSEGDEFFVRFHHKRNRTQADVQVSRSTFEMTDLLWDHYQDMIEQTESSIYIENISTIC
jgi:inhibitor of KinA sporulation pathway (predicted exonuclease)